MAENKTQPTTVSVADFLAKESDSGRLPDCQALIDLMQEATGEGPVMWGPSIIGFGCYHYRYESGREGDSPIVGFSPRKGEFALYLMPGCDAFPEQLEQLGKYKTGKSCLYIKRLSDVRVDVLRSLIAASVAAMEDKRVRRT